MEKDTSLRANVKAVSPWSEEEIKALDTTVYLFLKGAIRHSGKWNSKKKTNSATEEKPLTN